jgi:imidazolonepropionase-like amidohydrolase
MRFFFYFASTGQTSMLNKLLISIILSVVSLSVGAQPVADDLPRVTNCIALINVNLKQAVGKEIQKSHIVIRDGLITQVGPQITIPPDAFRIQADSLYAFPAFIDALSATSIKDTEGENTPASSGANRNTKPVVDAEGNVSLDEAGITPFKSVRSMMDPKEKSISEWRTQGFAIAHVVPKGKMIPGKGALVVLSGKNLDEMIWKEDVSLFSQWTGSGSYPATVIGVMAKWRELYHNAENYSMHASAYNAESLTTRPEYNQAHKALVPVIKKETPVFFKASRVKDISRALALQSDLGMKLVIADATEAWLLSDQLKARSIPLILSLHLPEDKSKAEKEKEEKGEKKSDVAKQTDSLKVATGEKPVADPEREAFEKRRLESLKQHRAQAAVLADQGVQYGFATISIKPADFAPNIKLMKDEGLTDDEALAALTTTPAKLLGIEKYAGTIDAGKMANIIVSNRPLFEKETAIKYMIVEGDLYEYEIKEKKKQTEKTPNEPTGPLAGTWSYVIETPDKNREGTFEFSGVNGSYTGKIKSDEITGGNEELENIVLDNGNLSFAFDLEMFGNIIALSFDLKLHGESFEGLVTIGEMGTFPIKGERMSKPGKK